MNELQIFRNDEFGEVRTVTLNNEPWFVAKDVACALGYSNHRDAIKKHVDDDDKGVSERDTLGGTQQMTIINESGLYSLVMSSKLDSAKRFKRWVTSEVLPSLRKNGGYIVGQEKMSDEELLSRALMVANNIISQKDFIIAEKEARIEQMKPKEIFADAVSTSHTSILIGDLAKLIQQNGVDIGQKRLFDWMRSNGYLIKQKGVSWNMPTQRAMEQGLFEVKESTSMNPDGSVRITKTTKVTGKGQVFFINKFMGKKNEKDN